MLSRADEDAFVAPERWAVLAYRRRGAAAAPAARSTSADLATVAAASAPEIRELLGYPETPADVAEAGLAYLGGTRTPRATAAVLATLILHRRAQRGRLAAEPLAHGLVAGAGLSFAAATAVEFATLSGFSLDRGRAPGVVSTGQNARYNDPTVLAFAGVVRDALAAADDAAFGAAVEALAAYRPLDLERRVVTSFLVPSRHDWVAADLAALADDPDQRAAGVLLAGAIDRPEQLALVEEPVLRALERVGDRLLHTVALTFGPASAPVLRAWAAGPGGVAIRRTLVGMCAAMPGDDAFRWVLEMTDSRLGLAPLTDAARRFPRRAVRILAGVGGRPEIGALLRSVVRGRPDAARAVLGDLAPAPARTVEALLGGLDADEAPADALPAVLVRPPWMVGGRARPVVVKGLVPPAALVDWQPGEQETWAAKEDYTERAVRCGFDVPAGSPTDGPAWTDRASRFDRGDDQHFFRNWFFMHAPEELAVSRLAGFAGSLSDYCALLGRRGLPAVPTLLAGARKRPDWKGPALLPVASVEVATVAADWNLRLRAMRPLARTWLERHAAFAARALIPAALSRPGTARLAAEAALRVLDPALVRTAAGEHGPAAAAGIEAMLTADPLDAYPATLPAVPAWLDPAALPPVRLAGGRGVLGADAVRHLLTMALISELGDPYAGLAEVRAACDPTSLDAFVAALLESWRLAGFPSKERWIFAALAYLGGEGTVRQFSALVQQWPKGAAFQRAVTGLDVLVAHGSDVALLHLFTISRNPRMKALRAAAGDAISRLAATRGLSEEELADRLVPDFGLDANGSMVLDYGPRRFTVGFDERLKPYVLDGDGTRRKSLPRPAGTDDQTLAPAAHARFAALRKEVDTVAAERLRALERAMTSGRTWTGAAFHRYLAGHPLVRHIARRLVWLGPGGAFRVADDRALEDRHDRPVALADDAPVRLAHPVRLGADETAAWSRLLADYEIMQPFPQLGREAHVLAPELVTADTLDRHAGATVTAGRVQALRHRGWELWTERTAPRRTAGAGLVVSLQLDPGLQVHHDGTFADQTLGTLTIERDGPGAATFAAADPVQLSEALRDLAWLTTAP